MLIITKHLKDQLLNRIKCSKTNLYKILKTDIHKNRYDIRKFKSSSNYVLYWDLWKYIIKREWVIKTVLSWDMYEGETEKTDTVLKVKSFIS